MVGDSEKIRLIIADDSILFIKGLLTLINANDNYEVIEIVHNGKDLINSENLNGADIILVDIDMPLVNGVDAAQQINFIAPHIILVAITMHKDIVHLNEIIQAGFKAFIYKQDVPETLFNVLDQVMKNNFVFPDKLKTINQTKKTFSTHGRNTNNNS